MKQQEICVTWINMLFSESTSGEKIWRTQGTFNFLGLPVGSGVLIQIVSCGKRFVADVAAKILVPMRLNMSSHIFAGYQFTTNLAQTFHLGCSEDTIELIRMKYQLTYTSIPDWKSYINFRLIFPLCPPISSGTYIRFDSKFTVRAASVSSVMTCHGMWHDMTRHVTYIPEKYGIW